LEHVGRPVLARGDDEDNDESIEDVVEVHIVLVPNSAGHNARAVGLGERVNDVLVGEGGRDEAEAEFAEEQVVPKDREHEPDQQDYEEERTDAGGGLKQRRDDDLHALVTGNHPQWPERPQHPQYFEGVQVRVLG